LRDLNNTKLLSTCYQVTSAADQYVIEDTVVCVCVCVRDQCCQSHRQ